MDGTIDDRYLEWLYAHVASVRNRNPHRSYWELMRRLYSTKFHWFIHNDDNRASDGLELRAEFIQRWGTDGIDAAWLQLDCSFLEMLIALSRRAAYDSHGSAGDWFWLMIKNLELRDYTDEIYEISIDEEVTEVLNRVNDRTYERDGTGGLFPLREPKENQRRVEIAYQLAAYLLENEYSDIRSKH